MKTLDEVIAYFDNQTNSRHVYLTDEADEIYLSALHYLQEHRELLQKTQQVELGNNLAELGNNLTELDNPPLTWDELKEMEGKPVWITEMISGRIVREYWDMVCILQYAEEDHIDFYKGPWRAKIELGKTWNAYRRERTE